MDRDPKSGKFLPGNQAARGARGNWMPKWGNRNHVTHGLYSMTVFPDSDGRLLIIRPGKFTCHIPPGKYKVLPDGTVIVGNCNLGKIRY